MSLRGAQRRGNAVAMHERFAYNEIASYRHDMVYWIADLFKINDSL